MPRNVIYAGRESMSNEVRVMNPLMFWLVNYDLKVRLLYARLEPWGA